MKKIAAAAAAVLMLSVLSLSLFSCFSENGPDIRRTYNVVLGRGSNYSSTTYLQKVERGENVRFYVDTVSGYEITDVSHGRLLQEGDTRYSIDLENVRYNIYLSVTVEALETEPEPGEDGPGGDEPGGDEPGGDEPGGDEPGGDEPGGDEPGGDEPGGDEPGGDEPEIPAHEENDPEEKTNKIRYYANGGTLYGKGGSESYIAEYRISRFERVNTETGEGLSRDGYTLTGWNTLPDGSGTHVGLGSRFKPGYGVPSELYAEWSEWTAPDGFSYTPLSDGLLKEMNGLGKNERDQIGNAAKDIKTDKIVITGYTGDGTGVLSVPGVIDGKTVVGIGERAFSSGAKTLVLPRTVFFVGKKAFASCDNLEELYMYESVTYVHPEAFGTETVIPGETSGTCSKIKKLHLNAVFSPLYPDKENGQFANKVELLAAAGSGQKIVMYGSCALFYGLDSGMVQRGFGAHKVFNMGTIGGTNSMMQIDIIKNYLANGDIFVYIPELASVYQMFCNEKEEGAVVRDCTREFEMRCFVMTESNYDLLSELDLSGYYGVWSAYNVYYNTGEKLRMHSDYYEKKYTDYLDDLDDHGDLLTEHPGGFINDGSGYDFVELSRLVNTNSMEEFRKMFSEIAEMGVRCGFGFGPINADNLARDALDAVAEYITATLNNVCPDVPILNSVGESIYGPEYFYDENYHLSSGGKIQYSYMIAEKMRIHFA